MALPLYTGTQTLSEQCAELACLIKAGDQEAMADLMALTTRRLAYELVKKGIDGWEDREDLLQQIYTDFWRSRHSWRPHDAYGYLLTTARHAAGFHLGKLLRRPDFLTTDPEVGEAIDADPAPGPEAILLEGEASAETAARWGRLVRSLPLHLLAVIRCRVRGMSPLQTAAALGISYTEVWDRTLEATRALRQAAGLPTGSEWLGAKLGSVRLPLPASMDTTDFVLSLTPAARRAVYIRMTGDGWRKLAAEVGTNYVAVKAALRDARNRLAAKAAAR